MRAYLSLFVLLVLACQESKEPGPKTFAAADIYTVSLAEDETYVQEDLIGNAEFIFQDGATTLKVNLSGMVPNTSHAMHLHQGTLAEPGRHWNQGLFTSFCSKFSLGEVWAKTFAGDVGNIDIDANGNGTFIIKTDLWSLGTDDDFDISGTVLFIHANSEDFANECDPNHDHNHGHNNVKIAGGTVVLDAQLLQ
ncbi:superoxide dismutase family protein [Ekhidna sp. To15]|uniref:superoxide dismutase family protein n=1 Tax=Ekhidna sp. To15 TaxID=3395267 RepID=UPI003F523562